MRSKHVVNTQRASAVNKPFLTEYRLAYKDPTASQKRKNPAGGKKQPAQVKPSEPIKEAIAPPAVEEVF
jgi:hypothetical protein